MKNEKAYRIIKNHIDCSQRNTDITENLYISNEASHNEIAYFLLRSWVSLSLAAEEFYREEQEEAVCTSELLTRGLSDDEKLEKFIVSSALFDEDPKETLGSLNFAELIKLATSLLEEKSTLNFEKHLQLLHKKGRKLKGAVWSNFEKKRFFKRLKITSAVIALLVLVSATTYYATRPEEVYQLTFYKGKELEGNIVHRRKTAAIKYNFGRTPVPALGKNNFSARAITCLELAKETELEFVLGTDDGSRILIDDTTIHSSWFPKTKKPETIKHKLPKGTYKLTIEYFQALYGAHFNFDIRNKGDIRLHAPDETTATCNNVQ